MILFTILLFTLIILVAIIALTVSIGGAGVIIIFGDVIVCIVFILLIMKKILRK